MKALHRARITASPSRGSEQMKEELAHSNINNNKQMAEANGFVEIPSCLPATGVLSQSDQGWRIPKVP